MDKIKLKKLKKPGAVEGLTPQKIQQKKDFKDLVTRVVLIVIVFPAFIYSIYLVMQNLSTAQPEITILAKSPGEGDFTPVSHAEINRRLDRDKALLLMIKVKTKADYYQSMDGGSKLPRDHMKIELEDATGAPFASTVIILRPDPKNKAVWTGTSALTIKKTTGEFKTGQFIRATRTNSTGTASLLTTRLLIKEK